MEIKLYSKYVIWSVFDGEITMEKKGEKYLNENVFKNNPKNKKCKLMIDGECYTANLMYVSKTQPQKTSVQISYGNAVKDKLKAKYPTSYQFYERYRKVYGKTRGLPKQREERISLYYNPDKPLEIVIKCEPSNQMLPVYQEQEEAAAFSKNFPEGIKKYVTHTAYERSSRLIELAKKKFQNEHDGKLFCEVCGFDFAAQYGERGEGFIEAHHDKNPVSQMGEYAESKVDDLKMVCANCHRILHRSIPWMRVDELRETIEQMHCENQ